MNHSRSCLAYQLLHTVLRSTRAPNVILTKTIDCVSNGCQNAYSDSAVIILQEGCTLGCALFVWAMFLMAIVDVMQWHQELGCKMMAQSLATLWPLVIYGLRRIQIMRPRRTACLLLWYASKLVICHISPNTNRHNFTLERIYGTVAVSRKHCCLSNIMLVEF